MICPIITDKVAVITGGAKGIGAQIARRFSDLGYAVIIGYRNSQTDAQNLSYELCSLGRKSKAVRADVSLLSEAITLRDSAYSAYGRCDVLVNNAGTSFSGLLADMNERQLQNILSDNLLSAINTTKAFYNDFAYGQSGCIINISSVWGLCGASCEAVYSAAKAGVIGFTKAMAKELAPCGVRVNAVAPGAILTDMLSHFSDDEINQIREEVPLGRLGKPDDVASAVLFLASEAASYITGETINISGGYVI